MVSKGYKEGEKQSKECRMGKGKKRTDKEKLMCAACVCVWGGEWL